MDGENKPIPPAGERDPALFIAFVEFKLKHNTPRGEIINQLVGKGLTYGQASTLVDSVETRLALEKKPFRLRVGPLLRGTAGGLFGAAVSLILWENFRAGLPPLAGYAGAGVLTGLGVSLAAWTRRNQAFPLTAAGIAFLAALFAVYRACVPADNLREAILLFSLAPAVRACLLHKLTNFPDLAGVVGAAVVAVAVTRSLWLHRRH